MTCLDPKWTVRNATEIEEGGNEAYRVTVETRDGVRHGVLKADGDSGGGDLSGEARVLRLLGEETSVPVPDVLGVVDDHPDLPAPFFLMDRLDGDLPSPDASLLSEDDLVAFARDVGRYLGEIHSLDAFDGFGPIVAERDVNPADAGGTRPLAREYGLTIPDPDSAWESRLAATAESMLDRLEETRFADLAPRIRDEIAVRRERLDLSGSPAIARIDHHPGNLVVDSESKTVTGMLDWGIVRTTHPEYELACAEQGFCGTISLEADRRLLVREALYGGYEEGIDRPPDDVMTTADTDDEFAARRRLHMLVFQTANMTWASGWITSDIADEAESDIRGFAEELL